MPHVAVLAKIDGQLLDGPTFVVYHTIDTVLLEKLELFAVAADNQEMETTRKNVKFSAGDKMVHTKIPALRLLDMMEPFGFKVVGTSTIDGAMVWTLHKNGETDKKELVTPPAAASHPTIAVSASKKTPSRSKLSEIPRKCQTAPKSSSTQQRGQSGSPENLQVTSLSKALNSPIRGSELTTKPARKALRPLSAQKNLQSKLSQGMENRLK